MGDLASLLIVLRLRRVTALAPVQVCVVGLGSVVGPYWLQCRVGRHTSRTMLEYETRPRQLSQTPNAQTSVPGNEHLLGEMVGVELVCELALCDGSFNRDSGDGGRAI